MKTRSQSQTKGTGIPRTQNREWGFFGTCSSANRANPEADWDDHDEQVKSYRARFAAFLGESDEGTELRGPCSRGGG